MTAKDEILALLEQIPDDLNVDEALERLPTALRCPKRLGGS